VRGVILQTYGSGNGPIRKIRTWIQELHKSNVIICIVTDCMHGTTGRDYGTAILGDHVIGPAAIPCYNMTSEAAYAKLLVALLRFPQDSSKNWKKEVRNFMLNNVRGETD
jgi:L-asparaginase/Glu-tRNA(Gln) amidotransferase subunit D